MRRRDSIEGDGGDISVALCDDLLHLAIFFDRAGGPKGNCVVSFSADVAMRLRDMLDEAAPFATKRSAGPPIIGVAVERVPALSS